MIEDIKHPKKNDVLMDMKVKYTIMKPRIKEKKNPVHYDSNCAII